MCSCSATLNSGSYQQHMNAFVLFFAMGWGFLGFLKTCPFTTTMPISSQPQKSINWRNAQIDFKMRGKEIPLCNANHQLTAGGFSKILKWSLEALSAATSGFSRTLQCPSKCKPENKSRYSMWFISISPPVSTHLQIDKNMLQNCNSTLKTSAKQTLNI